MKVDYNEYLGSKSGKRVNDAGARRDPLFEDEWPQTEKEVVMALSWCRMNPEKVAEICKGKLNGFKGKEMMMPDGNLLETYEGTAAVLDAITFLEKQRPLKAVDAGNVVGLSLSAHDHIGDLGQKGNTSHTGTNGSTPQQRMNRYGTWTGMSGECIWYGEPFDALDIVISLIIDDGVPDRGHRKMIYTRNFKAVGVGIGIHQEFSTMAVLLFAAGFMPHGPNINKRIQEGYKEHRDPEPVLEKALLNLERDPSASKLREHPRATASAASDASPSNTRRSLFATKETKNIEEIEKAEKEKQKLKEKESKAEEKLKRRSERSAKKSDPSPKSTAGAKTKPSSPRKVCFGPEDSIEYDPKADKADKKGPSAPEPPTLCVRCQKEVSKNTSIFATLKGKWHPECFACINCKTTLAGVEFNVHEDKEYCTKCYADKFAPRCDHCRRPLTESYLSYDNKLLHDDCFEEVKAEKKSKSPTASSPKSPTASSPSTKEPNSPVSQSSSPASKSSSPRAKSTSPTAKTTSPTSKTAAKRKPIRS